jgi:oligopeptide/dipeptide ABC transporter ATP-binding protein
MTLVIDGLTIETARRRAPVALVERASLVVEPGEIVGLIGESGSGKTLTAMACLGLLPRGVRIAGGSIRLAGKELTGLSERAWRALRGDRIALVPQDAMRGLNPVLRTGHQVGEPLNLHRGIRLDATLPRALELLEAVHVRDSPARLRAFPHELSGGMQQRAMIAMGLTLEPELLIADEPTTALDVTVQAQVLQLLREIRDRRGTAILFITHDLGIVASLCDRVYVMYAGAIVEDGPVDAILGDPRHPYTRALLRATPTLQAVAGELLSIPGQIPPPGARGPGCRFAERCTRRFARCAAEPDLLPIPADRRVRCWLGHD